MIEILRRNLIKGPSFNYFWLEFQVSRSIGMKRESGEENHFPNPELFPQL